MNYSSFFPYASDATPTSAYVFGLAIDFLCPPIALLNHLSPFATLQSMMSLHNFYFQL
jgi:hypothetical protein